MGKNTRVVYLTDGVLQRWLHENPSLDGVGAVVFDEFHERRVASDVALARCLDLQDEKRHDLKLVVMSAFGKGGEHYRACERCCGLGEYPGAIVQGAHEYHAASVHYAGEDVRCL